MLSWHGLIDPEGSRVWQDRGQMLGVWVRLGTALLDIAGHHGGSGGAVKPTPVRVEPTLILRPAWFITPSFSGSNRREPVPPLCDRRHRAGLRRRTGAAAHSAHRLSNKNGASRPIWNFSWFSKAVSGNRDCHRFRLFAPEFTRTRSIRIARWPLTSRRSRFKRWRALRKDLRDRAFASSAGSLDHGPGKVQGGVDQAKMRQGLRNIPSQAAAVHIIFFAEQADIV